YVAQDGGLVFGTSQSEQAQYTEWWGGTYWYDKAQPALYGKVCGDSLFAVSPEGGAAKWARRNGLIINSSIAIDRGRVYFTECRNPEIVKAGSGKVSSPELWRDLFLVALDAGTGKRIWERPLEITPGTIAFYGVSADDAVILVSSHKSHYSIATFDHDSGRPLWTGTHKNGGADHSADKMHPVIVGGMMYLEPRRYRLRDGQMSEPKWGGRSGCHTYLGSANALIYRGANRRVAMRSLKTGQVTTWPDLRPSCWLSMAPADGMLLVPEGGGGCSCGGWLETSVGFAPWNAERQGR
ncbi:MAG: outer membrane protein assembly factor BamB family protein, partial [Planctomycetota bacterium]